MCKSCFFTVGKYVKCQCDSVMFGNELKLYTSENKNVKYICSFLVYMVVNVCIFYKPVTVLSVVVMRVHEWLSNEINTNDKCKLKRCTVNNKSTIMFFLSQTRYGNLKLGS